MELPNASQARVEVEKVTGYLLSVSHPDGRTKAEFFARFGFQLQVWQILAEALLKYGASNQVTGVVESPYGTRYGVDGELETPDGRNPLIRTVWIIDAGRSAPRLITAYPIGS